MTRDPTISDQGSSGFVFSSDGATSLDRETDSGSLAVELSILKITITMEEDVTFYHPPCAVCGETAELYVGSAYFAVFYPTYHTWSGPPGDILREPHPSTGLACRLHARIMTEMRKRSKERPSVRRTVDNSELYCFENYGAHVKFVKEFDQAPAVKPRPRV